MARKEFVQKHFKEYLQGKKNDEVKKLKQEFVYKFNMMNTFSSFLIETYFAYS